MINKFIKYRSSETKYEDILKKYIEIYKQV